jgi:hypothetical protein
VTAKRALEQSKWSALGSWIAAGGAAIIAIFSLLNAQRAKDANRAWLLPSTIESDFSSHWIDTWGEYDADNVVSVRIPFKNVGKSPALGIKVTTASLGERPKEGGPTKPKDKIVEPVSVIAPDGSHVVAVRFKNKVGEEIARGPFNGYIFLEVSYRDILGLMSRRFNALYEVSCDTVGPDIEDVEVFVRQVGDAKIK